MLVFLEYDMFGKTIVASLAFLSIVSANPFDGRAPNKKTPKPDKQCAEFDYEKLSLREVGQRNTLVSLQLRAKEPLLTYADLAHVPFAPG